LATPQTPPSRDRIGDWAYSRLRDEILDGDLAPGSRLSVPDLARRLDVSRSPARESILRLVAEGLAEEVPHRGAFVADISTSQLSDLYSVRSVLEALAARLATEHATPASKKALRSAMTAHREAIAEGDDAEVTEADMAFHRLVYEMSENTWLRDALLRLQGLVRLAMRTTLHAPGSRGQALDEHQALMEAILSGDPEAAESKAAKHVDRLRETLLEQRG
jgi:DNA-binding GntR family transcriptional regulator